MSDVAAATRPRDRRGLRGAIAAHLGSRDVSRVIYGSIIGLALVVALEAHPPTPGQAAGAILGTAVAVALAEFYSELVGTEARTRRPIGRIQLRGTAKEVSRVMFGAGFPATFFVLAALGAFAVDTAFTLAKWSGLGLICAYGFLAGRLSGSGIGGSALHAVAVGAIGAVLIVFKALLH